jgi:hypothetical protein
MKSLFNTPDNDELIERISLLHGNSTALWGKMSVSQMVTHAQQPLKVALGELKLKRGLIGFLFGRIAKKKLLAEGPFSKNLPTDKNFLVHTSPEFEKERNELTRLVKRFAQAGPQGLSREKHPFFGRLSETEWDVLQWKHLDHHLRQFGV